MSDIHEFKAVRRRDGSIDMDFYRVRSLAFRRAALRDGVVLRQAFKSAVAVLGVIALVTLPAPKLPANAPVGAIASTQHCAAQLTT